MLVCSAKQHGVLTISFSQNMHVLAHTHTNTHTYTHTHACVHARTLCSHTHMHAESFENKHKYTKRLHNRRHMMVIRNIFHAQDLQDELHEITFLSRNLPPVRQYTYQKQQQQNTNNTETNYLHIYVPRVNGQVVIFCWSTPQRPQCGPKLRMRLQHYFNTFLLHSCFKLQHMHCEVLCLAQGHNKNTTWSLPYSKLLVCLMKMEIEGVGVGRKVLRSDIHKLNHPIH